MGRIYRVGTRKSALARAQTELVLEMLRRARPGVELEVVTISTEGDERRDVPIAALGGTGAFVKRLERALLAGEIDLAVHSLKDVPTALEPGLVLAGIPQRGDPRDVLVVGGATRYEGALPELPEGARIGTGSARRGVQLRALRPDLRILDVRGNVDTRLRKLDAGEYDALALALAGLERLGVEGRTRRALEPDEVVPMVGQGALAIEARADDAGAVELARLVDSPETRACVEAERAFLAGLGGGCQLPVGALARVQGSTIHLRVFLEGPGQRVVDLPARDAVEGARRLAAELLALT